MESDRERERKVKEKEIQKDTKIEKGKTRNQQETKMKKPSVKKIGSQKLHER